jgi:hypothetical protein
MMLVGIWANSGLMLLPSTFAWCHFTHRAKMVALQRPRGVKLCFIDNWKSWAVYCRQIRNRQGRRDIKNDVWVCTRLLTIWSDAEDTLSLFAARTDHPFFPPVASEGRDAKWMSVVENLRSIDTAPGWSEQERERIRGRNAIDFFDL